MDRPSTPLFVPAKTGVDVATEILPNDVSHQNLPYLSEISNVLFIKNTPFQLFDFHIEVKPILEVLVGKTLEQALLEVCEEEELTSIREKQLQMEEIRAADLMEMQRLEERERRYR